MQAEGPHLLLPLPGNYAQSQEGILLLRSLSGKELRGCGFQLLTTTFKACLHFSYGFQGTSLSNSQKRLVAERFCCPGGAGCRRALVTPGGGRREARAKPWGLGCCCRSPCLQHDKVQTPGRNATPSRGQPPITGLDGTRLGVPSWTVRLPPGTPLSLQSMRPFSSSSPPMVRPFFSLLYR